MVFARWKIVAESDKIIAMAASVQHRLPKHIKGTDCALEQVTSGSDFANAVVMSHAVPVRFTSSANICEIRRWLGLRLTVNGLFSLADLPDDKSVRPTLSIKM